MSRQKNDEPWLFDLPLTPDAEPEPAEDPSPPAREEPSVVQAALGAVADAPAPAAITPAPTSRAVTWTVPERQQTLIAGLLDAGVVISAVIISIAGISLLGVAPRLSHWPGLVAFGLTFSFLYFVVPLAFWGQTPGMGWMGLIARTREHRALTFAQCARRWLGALATAALLGAPWAFGWQLSDRLSGSLTYRQQL